MQDHEMFAKRVFEFLEIYNTYVMDILSYYLLN